MKRLLAGLLCAAALAGDAAQAAEAPAPALQPHAIVAAANPLAAQAGLDVLKHGGSAMDAAVAVQAVLALVEPQSSSLAGGSPPKPCHPGRRPAKAGRRAGISVRAPGRRSRISPLRGLSGMTSLGGETDNVRAHVGLAAARSSLR